jgi:hypothetical protein
VYKSVHITKENINKRGYNKFLEISDNMKVEIYQNKINEDEKWGERVYYQNLFTNEIYEQYSVNGHLELSKVRWNCARCSILHPNVLRLTLVFALGV